MTHDAPTTTARPSAPAAQTAPETPLVSVAAGEAALTGGPQAALAHPDQILAVVFAVARSGPRIKEALAGVQPPPDHGYGLWVIYRVLARRSRAPLFPLPLVRWP
jgi:hypothetical protein